MIDEVLRSLAGELTPGGPGGEPSQLRLRQGSIVSVQTDGSATVTIGGDTTPIAGVKVASHVCPIPGASCWLAVDGRDLFVMATLTPSGPAFGRMRIGANVSVAPNTHTVVNFTNRTAVRTNGMTDVNNGLSVQVPGWYQVSGTIVFGGAVGNRRGLRIMVSGSSWFDGTVVQVSPVPSTHIAVSGLVRAVAGEVIQLEAYQESSGAADLIAAPGLNLITAIWVRPIEPA